MTYGEWIKSGGGCGGILGGLLGGLGGLCFALATMFGDSNLHTFWTKGVDGPLSFLFYILMAILVLVVSVPVGAIIACAAGFVIGYILGIISSPLSEFTNRDGKRQSPNH